MSKEVTKPVTNPNPLNSYANTNHVTEMLKGGRDGEEVLNPQECLGQVDLLLDSQAFQRSEELSKLLLYLARHTLDAPRIHLKEYQIATEVFGRPPDFDPLTDSSVRVQMGRLRHKLSEYYKSDGANDHILVDVPKGRYALSFHHRASAPSAETAAEGVAEIPRPHEPVRPLPLGIILLAAVAGALLASATLLVIFHRQNAPPVVPRGGVSSVPTALQTFWTPFLGTPEAPIVVFSSAPFVGDPIRGMRYFDPTRDSFRPVEQHYTGVGEAMGMLELDRVLRVLGGQLRVKRASLFTLDDAVNNNLIFLGSPASNPPLSKISDPGEFVFRQRDAAPDPWSTVIVDLHPRAGDPSIFPPTARTRPMKEDYAIVALHYEADPPRWRLILEGISTIGTQAAISYVCHKDSLEELLQRLNVTTGRDLKPFEALLHVNVADDVPLKTQLLAVRKSP